jgi:hypothetical protein
MSTATSGDHDDESKAETSAAQNLHESDAPLGEPDTHTINLTIDALLKQLSFWLGNPAALVVQRHNEDHFTTIGINCTNLMARCMVNEASNQNYNGTSGESDE